MADLVDSRIFQKMLARNIVLPLLLSTALSAIFIGLVFYLLSVSRWVDHSDLVIGKTNEVTKLIIDSETGVRGFLVTGKDHFLEPYEKAEKLLPTSLGELLALVPDNSVQVERVQAIKIKFDRWNQYAQGQIDFKRAGNPRIVADADAGKSQMDQIRVEIAKLLEAEELLRSHRNESTQRTTYAILLAILVFSLSTGVFVAVSGRRQLLDLSKNYEGALKKQLEQNELLHQQAWIQSGAASVVEGMRGELTLDRLGEQILDFLVPYMGAVVGALYIRGKKGTLERVAGHASAKSFQAREGLVGQVATSGKAILLENLPEDYARITSGLGESRPRHLIVAPLTADGQVNAVVELGFFDSPPRRSEELLERIAESVGSAFRSAAYRSRLQKLLEESQSLTEELQTQQEELRVSNEELAQQTHALQDTQAKMETQHEELEQTNQLLEEQARQVEQQNTDLRSAREVVEQKARELSEANQYKSDFLANMSHELRTPLNSTLILAKLLKDNQEGNLTAEQKEFASTIYSAGNDLLNLINDILDLSKVEAGRLEIEPEIIPLAKVMKGMEGIFRPVARDKKIEFNIHLDDPAPRAIETDRQRLEQILKNLLSNAFKFTQSGSVSLRIAQEGKGRVSFSVIDTGIGIPAAQRDVIFDAFRQGDGSTNRNYGGTGLGLTISKNLARLLGGTISLTSKVGSGSCFTLILPEKYVADREAILPEDTTAPRSPAPEERQTFQCEAGPSNAGDLGTPPFEDDRDHLLGPGHRVLLVVEDEPQFAKILFDLSHELGFQCLVADRIADGFALAKQYLPTAVILDMKLPDGSGLSLLDLLKDSARTRHIPVHAISVEDHSREALHMGAVGYAFKPADREQLKLMLHSLEEKVSKQIRRVLVVEDDDTQRDSIQRLIGEKGVEIIPVGSGEGALLQLGKSTFDCMVIDLALPDMTGFELLEKMAQNDDLSFPPVIIYTGKSLSRAEEEQLRKYSKTIIIKGARSPERLLDEVTLFLHQVESQLSPERQQILKSSRNRDKSIEDRKILLVDDDVRNIFALRSALQQKGATVIVARNGQESLERLEEDPGISLVFMDIMMPVMDGYQAMREIRKQSRFAKLPIIAITAKAMKDDYERCLEAGASDYLAKPIDVDKLVSLTRVWLPRPLIGS